MSTNNKKTSLFTAVKALVKFTLLATAGLVIVTPSAIIAVGTYYFTGGKESNKYKPPPPEA